MNRSSVPSLVVAELGDARVNRYYGCVEPFGLPPHPGAVLTALRAVELRVAFGHGSHHPTTLGGLPESGFIGVLCVRGGKRAREMVDVKERWRRLPLPRWRRIWSGKAWLVLALGDDRQHGGNEGEYDDDPSAHYSWDNLVDNHQHISTGHAVVVWDGTCLLGASVIETIEEWPDTKVLRKCPKCKRASFKPRKRASKRFRCYRPSCFAEFDRPLTIVEDVTAYRSSHEGWVDLPGVLAAGELRALCVAPKSIQSIRELRWDDFAIAVNRSLGRQVLASLLSRASRLAGRTQEGLRTRTRGPGRVPAVSARGVRSDLRVHRRRPALDARGVSPVQLRRRRRAPRPRWPHPEARHHRLFDLGQLAVEPTTKTIDVAPSLRAFAAYAALAGKPLVSPVTTSRTRWLADHWQIAVPASPEKRYRRWSAASWRSIGQKQPAAHAHAHAHSPDRAERERETGRIRPDWHCSPPICPKKLPPSSCLVGRPAELNRRTRMRGTPLLSSVVWLNRVYRRPGTPKLGSRLFLDARAKAQLQRSSSEARKVGLLVASLRWPIRKAEAVEPPCAARAETPNRDASPPGPGTPPKPRAPPPRASAARRRRRSPRARGRGRRPARGPARGSRSAPARRSARVADPVAELVGDREAVAAGRGLAAHRLRRVDDDQPLRRDQHPRALAQVGLLDPQAEEVLGDRLDRHRDLVAAESGEIAVAELVGARVGVAGRG